MGYDDNNHLKQNDDVRWLTSEIAHKHTPDSIRDECYQELQDKYGISREKARELADELHGDYWG